MTNGEELAEKMQTLPVGENINSLENAIQASGWNYPSKNILNSPRQEKTIWLQASFHNDGDQALVRWLVVEPWRVGLVDAFFLSPESNQLLWHKKTGLGVPLQDRAISNGKTVIPIQLGAGDTQKLLLKISSDSLPFISIKSWEPVSYAQHVDSKRI